MLNQVFVNLKKRRREGKYYLSSARIRARYLGTYWVGHKLHLVSHRSYGKKKTDEPFWPAQYFFTVRFYLTEIGRGEGKDFLSDGVLEMGVKVGLGCRIPCWERGSAVMVAFLCSFHRGRRTHKEMTFGEVWRPVSLATSLAAMPQMMEYCSEQS